MFSTPITSEPEMRQVLSIYAQKVSTRLRKQGQVAGIVSAWAATAYHAEGPRHTPYISAGMPVETDDPIGIGKAAGALLPHLIPGTRYVRACVILTGLRPKTGATPLDLFQPEFEGRNIGPALDTITEKLGARAIGVGLGGLIRAPSWNMRREMLSRRATTHWEELCEARA
jgi:DNA polymerase V